MGLALHLGSRGYLENFRGEDVVSRWGGEEFTIAMYGSGREDGTRRVGELLDAFKGASIERLEIVAVCAVFRHAGGEGDPGDLGTCV